MHHGAAGPGAGRGPGPYREVGGPYAAPPPGSYQDDYGDVDVNGDVNGDVIDDVDEYFDEDYDEHPDEGRHSDLDEHSYADPDGELYEQPYERPYGEFDEEFDGSSDEDAPFYEDQRGFDEDDPYETGPRHGPGASRAPGYGRYHRSHPSEGRGGHPWHGSGAPPPGPDDLPPYPAMTRARGLRVPRFLAKLPGGTFVSVLGVAAVLLLVLVLGTGWYVLRGDGDESDAGAAGRDAGDGSAATMLELKKSKSAEKLFPKSVTPVDRSKHARAAVGEVPCDDLPAGDMAAKALDTLGCKKAYLALYVDKKKQYAVTLGYLDVGSKKKAKAGERKRYGDYPEYNTWFRFLVPEGSRVTPRTQVFTYVSSSGKYLTYGTGAYYDGRQLKDRMDETLMRETVAVGVAVGFTQ